MSGQDDNYPLRDLREISESLGATDAEPRKWMKQVRDKLFTMFCSPMKEEYTHEAFRWVSQLCISVGDFSWISEDGKWTQDEARMFSCVARLSINEIHILLPTIQRHLTDGDDPERENGKVLARSANSEDYDKFGHHLVILESIIKSLVKGQELDGQDGKSSTDRLADSMNSEDLKSLLERMKEAITVIGEYLELVHRHWQDLIDNVESEKFSSAEGAIRIMSVWLSEDPGNLEPQCKRFLIDLIVKNLLLDDRHSRNDLLVLALHSVATNSDELLKTLRDVPNHKEALEKYLKFVQHEQDKYSGGPKDRRAWKMFKLRCGLIKDLMT